MDFKYGYKCILDLLIGLIFITLNLIYSQANAKDLTYLSKLNNNDPIINTFNKVNLGFDLTYLNINHRDDYPKIFKKRRTGFNFYIGYDLNGIMLEAGYSFTTRRAKEVTIPALGTFLGLAVPNATVFTGKVRFKNTHLTLNFFSNCMENLKIVTAFGIGFVRPHTIFSKIDTATGAPSTTYTGVIASKTTMVPRVGLGFSLNHDPKIALRAMLYFDQYSKIRYKFSPTPDTSKAFKNAYTGLIGILFKL